MIIKIVVMLLLLITCIKADNQPESIKQILEEKLNVKPTLEASAPESPETKNFAKKYSFDFNDVPLVDVLHTFAAEKKINILLPQGSQALTTKIKYSLPYKVTLDQAWEEINKIIDLIGYTWEIKSDHYTLLKIDPNIQRESLPLFINPPLESLPDNGQVVEAIFYLSNLKVNDQNSPLEQILKAPTGMLSPTALLKTDAKTNALIIIDKSNVIRAAMTIVRQLDLEGIPDDIHVIPLYFVQASFVEELFKKLLATAQVPVTPGVAREAPIKSSSYFPPNTKVLALDRTNNIVIMGTTRSIHIVKEFIVKYIDHPLDSGKSILHLYDLQYLNAEEFAPILQQLVNKQETGSQSQGQAATGPRRAFQDVIVEAEKTSIAATIAPSTVEGQPEAAKSEGVQQGGNRLLIAARKEDWIRIKKLIKDLDTPQPQVAIEVLVVDLTSQKNQILGTQMRNKGSFHSSALDSINFQAANLVTPILSQQGIANEIGETVNQFPADALMANLLQLNQGNNLANLATPGSVIISFNDQNGSGIWNVMQILDRYANTTILTQPFIVTMDNKQATISLAQQRLLPGGANSDGGSITVKNEYVTAATAIDILPTISEDSKNINLQLNITVNEFLSNANNRATRLIQTNANIGDGEVLALGGLVKISDQTVENDTPFLSQIPLLGWFFKRRNKTRIRTNLMVFICPKIIKPRVGGGFDDFTKNKLCFAENDLQDSSNFEDLRDPITRWFFKPDQNFAHDVIDDYVSERPEVPIMAKAHKEDRDKIRQLENLIRGQENPLSMHEAKLEVEQHT
jgi:general secretion pathway protein D